MAKDIYNYLLQMVNGGSHISTVSNLNIGSILGKAIGNTIVATANALWENEDRNH